MPPERLSFRSLEMEMLLNVVNTMALGMLVGTELAVSAFVNPVLGQVGGVAEAQATRLFAKKLGALMPFWYCLCFLLSGSGRRRRPIRVVQIPLVQLRIH